MAGHFNPFGPGYSLMPPYYAVNEQGQRVIPPANYVRGLQGFPPHRPGLTTDFLEFDDPSRTVLPAQGSQRVRRRVGASGEHVKFRRTRSGCYTCRTRRVKCDEGRPICERCRKGNRECTYPERPTATKPRRSSTKLKAGEGEEGSEDYESDGPDIAIPLDDEELAMLEAAETPSATTVKSDSESRETSDPPSLTHGKSPTPSTEGSATIDPSAHARPTPKTVWSQLPQDVQFYLQYARKKLTPYHWGFKYYDSSFLETTLLEVAVRFEPLLYAVVGFAAYHRTLTKTNGKLHDFLDYYNRSVSLLRQSLKKNEKHTIATLLTILQLATIEEYLGDWVNCMAHSTAAYQILTELYTPETVVENESLRMMLQWYVHFDVFAGMTSGNGTVLGREWFQAQHDWDRLQVQQKPDDIKQMYRERFSRYRVVAADAAIMFAKRKRGVITQEELEDKCKELMAELDNGEEQLNPALKDPSKLITDFSGARPRDPESIVDPYEPNILYGAELFPTNHLIVQIMAMRLMFRYQMSEMQGKPRMAQGQQLAFRMCQLIEAMQYYPGSPPSILLGLQANVAMASAWLPQDEKHSMWGRRKLAAVEAQGYVYPAAFRARMAQAWNADVSDWWLPNEEGRPPLIKHIRHFIANRGTVPKGARQEDLMEMKGVFSQLNISDSSSPESYHGSSSKDPTPQLRRSASDPAPAMKQSPMNLDTIATEGTDSAIDDEAMVYGDSPEYEWGYEQQSWEEP